MPFAMPGQKTHSLTLRMQPSVPLCMTSKCGPMCMSGKTVESHTACPGRSRLARQLADFGRDSMDEDTEVTAVLSRAILKIWLCTVTGMSHLGW